MNRALTKKVNLPDDIIYDILLRLPSESLYRFKSVSKTWHGLTFNRQFLKFHADRVLKDCPFPLLMFYKPNPPEVGESSDDDDCEFCNPCKNSNRNPQGASISHRLVVKDKNGKVFDEFQIPLGDFGGEVVVIHSGHGLVCMRKKKERELFVCNLSTREWMQLPGPGPSVNMKEFFALSFIPKTNEYKLFHLHYFRHEEFSMPDSICRILNIRSDGNCENGTWRLFDGRFPYRFPWFLDMVDNVDGAVYWWLDRQVSEPHLKLDSIISVDMEREVFLEISKPQGCSEFDSCMSLVGLKGQLSLTKILQNNGSAITMDIWMLKDPANSTWAKQHSISLPLANVKQILPMYVGARQIMLKASFSDDQDTGTCFYNLETRCLEDEGDVDAGHCKVGPYIWFDHLFPLKGPVV